MSLHTAFVKKEKEKISPKKSKKLMASKKMEPSPFLLEE